MYTTTLYDGLSRIQKVTEPDGAFTSYQYYGNQTTKTDPNNHATVSVSDAWNRLTQITDAANSVTGYGYDVLDDLVSVNQSGQMRSFAYDSLRRLVCASNPERRNGTTACTTPLPASGVDLYSYDANGNLTSRTDANGTVTAWSLYDALNRPGTKSYSDHTPAVAYAYDIPFKGAPSSVATAAYGTIPATATTYNSYDSMGRVTQSTQTTGNSSFHFSYAYNRNGDREWVQYPSGRQVATCYDAAARPAQVQNFATQTNYVSGVQYAPHGALSQVNYKNGDVESTSYNTRLQPSSIGVSLGGANALTLGYVPLYPPLARAAKVQGVVHIKVATDGTKVVTAQAEGGNRLLAAASEENARTWQFSKHEPTSFTVTYRYRLDANADPNNPTVTLRFPTEVDVSIAPLVLSDPPAEIKK